MSDRRQQPDRREEPRVPARGRRGAEVPAAELLARAERGEALSVPQLQAVLAAKNMPSTETTVRRWIREGKIDVERTFTGRVRVPGSEVLAILRWRAREKTPRKHELFK